MTIKLTIPTSLKDITLEQYQRFMYVTENNKDEEFITQKMIEIFCGVPLHLVSQLPLIEVKLIIESLENVFEEKPKLQRIIKLGNVNFGFIPNLDKISLGEYADLSGYIDKWDKMHKGFAVLYRPITDGHKDKYQIEEYKGSEVYADVMKHLTLDVVIGARLFFWNLMSDLLNSSLKFIQNNKELMDMIDKHNSQKNGNGIPFYINSLREILDDSMKFLKLRYF